MYNNEELRQDVAVEIYTAINDNDIDKLTSDKFYDTLRYALGEDASMEKIQSFVKGIIVENGWKEDYIKLMSDREKPAKLNAVNVELSDWVMVSRRIRTTGIIRKHWLPSFEEEYYISIFQLDGKEVPMYGFDFNSVELGLLRDGYHFVRYNDPDQNELVYYKEPVEQNLSNISAMLRRLLNIIERNIKGR